MGLLHEDHLVDGAPAPPPVLRGPSDTQPSVLAHPADVADVGRLLRLDPTDLGDQGGEIRTQLALQGDLCIGQCQAHRTVHHFPRQACDPAGRRGVPSLPMSDSLAPTPPAELFSVSGKIVVVTGGTRGIGRMIAAGFVAAGAEVVVASRKADAVAAAVDELSELGTCSGIPVDLSSEGGARLLADAVADRHTRVDVLVNNAGATWGAPLAEHDTGSWDRVLNLNVQGVFHTTKFLLPLLEAASSPDRPSRVINIGSIDGIHVPMLESYSYSASKAAVHQLTRHLAKRLAPDHRQCGCARPLRVEDDGGNPRGLRRPDRGSCPHEAHRPSR